MEQCTKVRAATIWFCDNLSVDGYELPDGSFWVSVTSASVAVGFARNWLGRSMVRGGHTLKALSGAGFGGKIEKVVTPSMGGEQVASLISVSDFSRLILYAAGQGKKEAIALADALLNMAMIDFFRDAFGYNALTIEQKRENFYKAYANTLTREDWLAMDRHDVRLITEQLRFVGVFDLSEME